MKSQRFDENTTDEFMLNVAGDLGRLYYGDTMPLRKVLDMITRCKGLMEKRLMLSHSDLHMESIYALRKLGYKVNQEFEGVVISW